MWRSGEVIALRDVWFGEVWRASPGIVVEDGPALTAVCLLPGSEHVFPVDGDGREVRLPRRGVGRELRPGRRIVLALYPAVAAWSIWHFYENDGSFGHWYVNFEQQLGRGPRSIDYVDHKLDLIVQPDGGLEWKDEDELEEAGRLGLLDAAAVRRDADAPSPSLRGRPAGRAGLPIPPGHRPSFRLSGIASSRTAARRRSVRRHRAGRRRHPRPRRARSAVDSSSTPASRRTSSSSSPGRWASTFNARSILGDAVETRIPELRAPARHRIRAGEEALDAVVEPRLGQAELLRHAARLRVDRDLRLKNRVDVLGRAALVESERDRSAADDVELRLEPRGVEPAAELDQQPRDLSAIHHTRCSERAGQKMPRRFSEIGV